MGRKEMALQKSLRQDIQTNRSKILKEFGGKCQVCNLDINEFLEIHHILPITEGGNNEFYNLTVLCPTCHKALHVWRDQKNGSEVINSHYINHISYEEYMRLADLLRESIRANNERVEKITTYHKSKIKRLEA